MNDKLPIIAIDGPAGVGKTSVSRALAEALGFYFFSSGLIYRVIAWRLIEAGWRPGLDIQEEKLGELNLSIGADGGVILEGQSVVADLHAEEISTGASVASTVPAVRELSNRVQRETVARIIAEKTFPGVILEGRDIGTVVFPEARHKIFLTASEEVRAQRRFLERKDTPGSEEQSTVQAAIRERDQRDANRDVAPLKPAEDAMEIDTGPLSLEEVVASILTYVRS